MEAVRHEVGSSFSDEVRDCGEGVDVGWGDTSPKLCMLIKTYSKCINSQLLCSASTDVAASSSSDSNKLLLLGIIDMLLLFAWPRTPIDPSLYV